MKILPDKENKQKGQTVLIILLLSIVILTVGLSVVSRSVTDVKISTQSQEAARAFWVAQGSLEKSIKAKLGSDSGDGVSTGVSYNTVKLSAASANYYIFPEPVGPSERVTFWLTNHDSPAQFYNGDSLSVYWGNVGESSSEPTTPAMEATLIYQNAAGSEYFSRKYPFDPNGSRLSSSTHFLTADYLATGYEFGGQKFVFKGEITGLTSLPSYSKPLFLDLKLIFNNNPQIIGVQQSSGNVYNQQETYESTATVTNSNVTRKLRETVSWSRTPDIFDYLLFSGGNL